MDITVRKAKQEDISQIIELDFENFSNVYPKKSTALASNALSVVVIGLSCSESVSVPSGRSCKKTPSSIAKAI